MFDLEAKPDGDLGALTQAGRKARRASDFKLAGHVPHDSVLIVVEDFDIGSVTLIRVTPGDIE
jgi:hypothetical protein